MDRVRLAYNIARVRKQLFSIVASFGFGGVMVATILGHGFDVYRLFYHSAVAILVFGALGFAAGRFYMWIVEEPLIESYRKEAQERIEQLKNSGPQRVAMEISVGELQPGMKAVETIQNKDGALLVRAGSVLNARSIKLLRENGIDRIKIEGQRNIATAQEIADQMGNV